MTISVNWPTKVINIPQADLTYVSPGLYELDIDAFRLTLRSLEDDLEGIPFLRTHTHNTEVSFGGLTLARVVQIVNGYTVTFEDGQYAVQLVGANSNIGDVVNVNQVSVRTSNSAGLIVYTEGGSVPTAQENATAVWSTLLPAAFGIGSAGEILGDNLDEKISDVPTVQEIVDAVLNTPDSIDIGQDLGGAIRALLTLLSLLSSYPTEAARLLDIYRRFGLDATSPVTHSETGIDATGIDIDITDNQDGTFTEQRQ